MLSADQVIRFFPDRGRIRADLTKALAELSNVEYDRYYWHTINGISISPFFRSDNVLLH